MPIVHIASWPDKTINETRNNLSIHCFRYRCCIRLCFLNSAKQPYFPSHSGFCGQKPTETTLPRASEKTPQLLKTNVSNNCIHVPKFWIAPQSA